MIYLEVTLKQFHHIKRRAEEGIAQLTNEEIFYSPDNASNSIAVILKHISGNMHSRWVNFFSEDGEKLYRDRENEFIYKGESKEQLMQDWEHGWSLLFDTLESINESNLTQIIYLRQKPMSAMEAIQIELSHLSYHLGQILYIGKLLKGEHWKTLSIPRDKK